MTQAALLITLTSETCARYELIRDGRRIWINRVAPTPQGHAGARARMAAWAKKHEVQIEDGSREERRAS